jgi:hypothetical protein
MPIGNISNNELGSSVRSKLNAVINAVNPHLVDRYFYRALIQQTGTNTPTEVRVFDDSWLTIASSYSWSRTGTGVYVITTGADTFLSGNNYYMTFHFYNHPATLGYEFEIVDVRNLRIRTYLSAVPTDGLLGGVIEIIVFPS